MITLRILLFKKHIESVVLMMLHCIQDLELAKTVLRPGKWFMNDLSKESLLTKEKFGSVNRVFIVCNEDLLIKESLQKWYIEHSRTDDVKVIAGADHMPMFSKPKELCQCLQEIAEKYN